MPDHSASTAGIVLAVTPAKEPSSKAETKEPPRWRRWTAASVLVAIAAATAITCVVVLRQPPDLPPRSVGAAASAEFRPPPSPPPPPPPPPPSPTPGNGGASSGSPETTAAPTADAVRVSALTENLSAESDGLSTGAIVGIATGAVVAGAIIGALAVWRVCVSRRAERAREVARSATKLPVPNVVELNVEKL